MSYVYLIKSEESVYKIGFSANPLMRLKQLQTSSPDKLFMISTYKSNNARKIETALHNVFGHSRKTNEWFNLCIEDELNFLKLCEKTDKNLKLIEESN